MYYHRLAVTDKRLININFIMKQILYDMQINSDQLKITKSKKTLITKTTLKIY